MGRQPTQMFFLFFFFFFVFFFFFFFEERNQNAAFGRAISPDIDLKQGA